MTSILLIEDSMTQAKQFSLMMSEAGLEIKHAASLEAGLTLAKQGGSDVILLDLTLPDSEGLQTFRSAHAQVPQVPIVVLTSVDDEELAATTIREGAQDYLVKGEVSQNWLVRAIQHAIARASEPSAAGHAAASPESVVEAPINIEQIQDVTVVRIKVNRLLDARHIAYFSEKLVRSMMAGSTKMVISFKDVDYVANGALGALIALRRKAKKRDGMMALCDVSENVYEHLSLRQLHKLFDIHDDVETAIQDLTSR